MHNFDRSQKSQGTKEQGKMGSKISTKTFWGSPQGDKDRGDAPSEGAVVSLVPVESKTQTGAGQIYWDLAPRARRLTARLAKEIAHRNAEMRLSRWLALKKSMEEAKEMEGVEEIGPISDVVTLISNVDAVQNFESAMSGTDGTIDDQRGKANDNVKLDLKKKKALDEVLKKEVKIPSKVKNEEKRRDKIIEKGRAERVAKTKKPKLKMNWRALEPAKKINKMKKEKKKDMSVKLTSRSGAKVIKDQVAVDFSLNQSEETDEKKDQTDVSVAAEKTEAVNITLPPSSIDVEEVTTSGPTAREGGEPEAILKKNETEIKSSTNVGVEADEETTEPGSFWSFLNSQEDLDLSFLNEWKDENDSWLESVSEGPIVNSTERVLLPTSSEIR